MKVRFNLPVLLFILLTVFVHRNQSAPALEDEDIEGGGCYYMFNQYSEGDRILTQEPCLNCTCHNSMLMCYLRVCPFTKPIGQDCTIEKKSDQCCPVITCPEVPVLLLSPSTSTLAPSTTLGSTALSSTTTSSTELALLEHGCQIGEKYYPDGAQVVSDYEKPCELCYCIRNRTACVMQECILHVEGCTPIFEEGVCCPVRYKCDGTPEIDSTTQPFTHFIGTTISSLIGTALSLASTTGHPGGCYRDGEFHADGSQIQNLGEAPCEHCYCMRGEIVCAVQECGAPLENEAGNCTAIPPRAGLCCPEQYSCNDSRDVNELEESSIVSQNFVEKRPEGVEAIDDEVTEETLPLAEPQSSTIKEVIELIENQAVGENAVEEKAPVVEPASTEKISNYVEDQSTEREQPSPLPETTAQYTQQEQEQPAEEPQKFQDEDIVVKTTQNPKVADEPSASAEPEANVSEEILSHEPDKATTEYVETEPSSSTISQVELTQTTKSSIIDSKPLVIAEEEQSDNDEVQAATTIRIESDSPPSEIADSEPQVQEVDIDDLPKTTVEPIVPVIELVESEDVNEAQKPEAVEEQVAQTTTHSTPAAVNELEPEKDSPVESAEQEGQVHTTTTESQQVFLSEKDQEKENEKEPITSATSLPEPLPSLPDEGQGQETTLSSILSIIGDSLSQIKEFVRPQEVVDDRVSQTQIGEMMPEPEKLSDRSTVPPPIQIGNEIVIVGEDTSESSSHSTNVHITTFRPFVGEKEQSSEEILAETSTHKEIISSSSAPSVEQTEIPTTEKEVQELTSIDWSLKVTTTSPTTIITTTTTTESSPVTVEEEQHSTTIVSVSSTPAEQPEEKDQTTTSVNQIVQDDDDEQFVSSTTSKAVEQSTSASNEIASTESSSTLSSKDHEHHEHEQHEHEHEQQSSEEPISSSVSESASSSTEHSSQNTVENVSEESSSTGTGSVMLTHEDNVATTDESEEPEAPPPPKPIRVPGEGSCFVEGKTYKNGSRIPPSSPCQLACACQNSIVHCLLVHCQPPPSDQKSCRPIYTPGICCPSYECIEEPEQQTSAPEIIAQEPEQPESSAPINADVNEVSSPAQDKVSHDQSIDESIKTVVDGGEEQPSLVAPINQDDHIVIEKDNEIVSIVPDEPQVVDLKTNASAQAEPAPEQQEPENPIIGSEIEQSQTPDHAEETDIGHQSINTENEIDHLHLHHHQHQQPQIQTEILVPAPPVNQEMAQNIEALTQMLVNEDLDQNEYIMPNADSQQQQTLDHEQESIDRENILQAILNMSETSTTSSPHYPVTMTTSMSSSPAPVTTDHSTTSTMTPMTSGACLFDGKVYMSAQQIPRSDPCDFCFCFRGDIICLQQSCPPPIPGCYEEPIPGFCCPRYECPVGSGNSSNVQTHFPPSFYHNQLLNSVGTTGGAGGGSVAPSNIASGPGCEIQGEYFETGQIITSTSGPCLECRCGATGLMECDPRECQPEPMLRKMIAAITSR